MRYYRATANPKRCGAAIHAKIRTQGASVYDLWLECGEDWSSVQVIHDKYEDHKTTEFKLEDYKTRAQLVDIYKNEAIVDSIISDKRARGGQWTMRHPECPLDEAMLYLCWAGAGTRKEDARGSLATLRGAQDMDTADKDTARTLSALFEGHKAVAGMDSSLQNESGQHILDEAAAAAVARLEAGREEEAEAAAVARDEKRREVAAQRSPSDIARAGVMKLCNVAAARLRALQAAQVEVLHLPKTSPEEISAHEL
jgi:hypothetical protein